MKTIPVTETKPLTEKSFENDSVGDSVGDSETEEEKDTESRSSSSVSQDDSDDEKEKEEESDDDESDDEEKKEEEKEKDEEKEEEKRTTKIGLLFGDIITITSQHNPDYHQQTFYVDYIDRRKMTIINIATLETHQIIFEKNEDIERIAIVNRSDVRGYARQNDLIVGKWIDIHFGGEIPKILTGEITNLEEDCIEITLFPELEKIYIDFEYKGIPLDIPIENIHIREKPSSLINVKSIADISVATEIIDANNTTDANNTKQDLGEEANISGTDSGEYIISIPEKYTADQYITEQLSQEYHKGDDIIFGEELGTTTFYVEIPEVERRYGIDIQTTDLIDELLSTIPNSKRTPKVMDTIRCLIERYKELRTQFSVFDDNGYIIDRKRVTAQYKPIIQKLESWNTPIKWILPTVKQRQKLYTLDESTLEMNSEANDYSIYSVNEDISDLQTIYQQYLHNHSNENTSINGYENCYNKFSVRFQPFEEPILIPGVSINKIPIYQVNSPFECMINNNDDYESSFFTLSSNSNETLNTTKYNLQKLNVGMTRLITENIDGAKTARRQSFTENEKMHIQSLLIMPEPVITFSHIQLPATDIYTKVNFHQNYVDYFRLFHKKREIKTDIVDLETSVVDFTTNNNTDIREFILDEKYNNDEDGLRKMMNVVFPKTRTIINRMKRQYLENLENNSSLGNRPYSFVDCLSKLEPYFIYSNDITYKQYQEIRYFLKQNKNDFAKNYVKKQSEFQHIRRSMEKRNRKDKKDLFKYSIFTENVELFETFQEYYKNLTAFTDSKSSSEKLNEIINIDQSVVLNDLITFLLIPLTSTDNIIDLFKTQQIDDMTGTKKKVPSDCATRILTKRYTSLHQLHEDDKTNKIYYDAEFDTTPYEIAKTEDYLTKKKSLSPEKFQEYLKILLEKKYGVSTDESTEMAITLIAGKKLVKNGEYCILEIVPISVEGGMEKMEKIEESFTRQLKYYKRINHVWVHDSSVDKHSFIDTNTLFCNYDAKCYKPTKKDTCETISNETRSRFIDNDRKRILKEFDDRIELSVSELKELLGKNLKKHLRRLQLSYRLKEIQTIKTDITIYELYGKRPNAYEFLSSPYAKLRDMILSQSDFAKKQQDILRFIDSFCRKAMVDELKDDSNWYYCKETNVKLLPTFFYSLAYVFTTGGDYSRKQDELCREIGILSDDGSSIVDKHSGYIIRNIDFVSGYLAEDTEESDIYNQIASDITDINLPTSLTVLEKNRDYEDPQSAMIYRVIKKLATDIGISAETIHIDKMMGIALKIIDGKVPREEKYKKSIEKAENQGKKLIPYDIYKNRAILFITSGLFFISVQTAIPNFQLKKTFPGCVRSLQGYPLTGMENTTGIEYISCILYAIKSSFPPYNGIEKLKRGELQTQFKDAIQKYIIEGGYPDVEEMLENKRRWLLTQHEEPVIPKEHQLERMVHFQPPFVDFSVIKSLVSVSKSFREELENLMRTGNKAQRESISLIKSRLLYFGYGIIEAIHKVVNTQDVVLKTISNIPFIENACCLSSKKDMIQPMQFFIKAYPQIQVYLHASSKLSAFMARIDRISKAALIFHPESTALVYISNRKQTTVTNQNIYSTFIHYCNFDKETYPVPEYLSTICSEKPSGWNPKWTLDEKIMKLTLLKTNFNEKTCRELLKIIQSRNLLTSFVDIHKEKSQLSKVSSMMKRLELLTDTDDTFIIDERFRDLLMRSLKTYRPLDVSTENNEEIKQLNKYLSKANGMMLKDILDFLYENSVKLGARAYEKIEDFVTNIMKWNLETSTDGFYTIIQFIKNSVYSMCNLYPAVIQNNSLFQTIPKHWGISEKHAENLLTILGEYWKRFEGFKNDKIIMNILSSAGVELRTMTDFIGDIPIFAPIYHNGKEYYSLFNKETTYLLFSYCWYSVLYEYVKYANDMDMLNTDIQEKRQQRKEYRNDRVESRDVDRIPENEEDYIDMRNTQIMEMEIQIGESSELRKRVCSLLIEMLKLEDSNKKSLDYDYSKISYEIRRLKYEEKKRITDRMGNMDIDTRRIEMMLKKYKMGVWKEQKGLVNYDKETYNNETSESMLIDQLKNIEGTTETLGEDVTTEAVDYEIDDLDRIDAEDAEDNYETELNDFTGLDEDYDDGYDPDGYGEYGADDF